MTSLWQSPDLQDGEIMAILGRNEARMKTLERGLEVFLKNQGALHSCIFQHVVDGTWNTLTEKHLVTLISRAIKWFGPPQHAENPPTLNRCHEAYGSLLKRMFKVEAARLNAQKVVKAREGSPTLSVSPRPQKRVKTEFRPMDVTRDPLAALDYQIRKAGDPLPTKRSPFILSSKPFSDAESMTLISSSTTAKQGSKSPEGLSTDGSDYLHFSATPKSEAMAPEPKMSSGPNNDETGSKPSPFEDSWPSKRIKLGNEMSWAAVARRSQVASDCHTRQGTSNAEATDKAGSICSSWSFPETVSTPVADLSPPKETVQGAADNMCAASIPSSQGAAIRTAELRTWFALRQEAEAVKETARRERVCATMESLGLSGTKMAKKQAATVSKPAPSIETAQTSTVEIAAKSGPLDISQKSKAKSPAKEQPLSPPPTKNEPASGNPLKPPNPPKVYPSSFQRTVPYKTTRERPRQYFRVKVSSDVATAYMTVSDLVPANARRNADVFNYAEVDLLYDAIDGQMPGLHDSQEVIFHGDKVLVIKDDVLLRYVIKEAYYANQEALMLFLGPKLEG